MNKEISVIKSSPLLTDDDKNLKVKMIEENRKYFEQVFNENAHKQAIENGETSLSYNATMSALLISLYENNLFFALLFKFLTNIVEIDHKIANWRFRHTQMVEKTLES